MNQTLTLIKNDTYKVAASLRMLFPSDIDAIMHLQQQVYEGLEDKEIYLISSRQEILSELLLHPGHLLGVVTEEDGLIALGIYKTAGQSEHNYGRDYGLTGAILDEIGHVDTTIVHSDFRGNHLQQYLIEAMEEIAKEDGMTILCSTVSPYNTPSLNTFLKLGFEIKQDKLKYGGLRRYVMAKSLV